MTFTPINSSSLGNAYLVESDGVSPLLLEAGIPLKQLRQKVHFGLSGLAGVLISHSHMDHAKAVKDLLKAGVDIYTSRGTADDLGISDHYRTNVLRVEEQANIAGWTVLPFLLEHDTTEPFGFLVGHGNERLLFIPDTGYVKNRFKGVNILALECNHLEELLSDNIVYGHNPALGRRIRRNHLSLERAVTMLKENDLSQCREVWLLHLSSRNSDEAKMLRTVQETLGIPTRVCEE